jgi:Flp pilus assembly protein TadG
MGPPTCTNERGAAAIEFALVLPLLILLVFGIFEFSRAYNALVTLEHAAREGVRVLAITGDAAAATTATLNAAPALPAGSITVTSTACDPGQPTEVAAAMPFSYNVPLFNAATITLTGTGVMRCGG